jgi:hypothetical protein
MSSTISSGIHAADARSIMAAPRTRAAWPPVPLSGKAPDDELT